MNLDTLTWDDFAIVELRVGRQAVGGSIVADKQIAPLMSEWLFTGFRNECNEAVLCNPDRPGLPGGKLL